MDVNHLFVVGAGAMGRGIAQVAIQSGVSVTLCDVVQGQVDSAKIGIANSLTKQVSDGRMSKTDFQTSLALLHTTTRLQDAADADIVIEAIVEKLEAKKQVFAELSEICQKDTVFASNTSTISITGIAAAATRPERFAGMHFFNPVPSMKLLEIIPGLETSAETLDIIQNFGKRIQKVTILAKDSGGFVVNRIFSPMLNAAVNALDAGLGSREDIDNGLKFGCGHPMGPLALIDLVGFDVQLDVMEVLYAEFGTEYYKPAPMLRRMVAAGHLGRKTGKGFYEY